MRKLLPAVCLALCVLSAHADEPLSLQLDTTLSPSPALMTRALDGAQATLDAALGYLGIRYRRGGSSPETGFDCSGFVRHVFNESVGRVLPHSAAAISKEGTRVEKAELQPGDLVFFNTMRKAFSHVGIYLGDSLFVHAPRSGGQVRIEDMTDRYWSRRYNGARRVAL
ncbi:MAG: C40 family peptidase [Pseudomonadota bacterium]